jgi:tetratricopeptide (TPR) repeat protein
MTITRAVSVVAILLTSSLTVSAAAAQDTLARVRDLYTSAAYDEALALLNDVERPSASAEAEVDQYRAFCLLALGRNDDAKKVIQQIVEANPSFQPSDAQASPRLKDAFRDVRRRVLPSIVRQTYFEAKLAFDRKDIEAAGIGFESVVALLEDVDAAGAGDLADLRILSKGFLDLIKTAPPAAAPAAAAAPAPAAPDLAPVRTIFGPADTDVTPPVAISQPMPPWYPARHDTQVYTGALILSIDESGAVTAVKSQGQLPAPYLAVLRRAANSWTFQPAMRNGAPVKYSKIVGIRLSPTGD